MHVGLPSPADRFAVDTLSRKRERGYDIAPGRLLLSASLRFRA